MFSRRLTPLIEVQIERAVSIACSSVRWAKYEKQKDAEKGKKLVKFLDWALRDGQKHASDLHYAPLPPAVATKAQASLKKITGPDGAPLLAAR